MKSVVDVQINASQDEAAALFADPSKNPEWMDEVDMCEPLSGNLGMPGSSYRMVGKPGTESMDFIATVVARDLPDESRLLLEGPDVVVAVSGKFTPLSPAQTRLVSQEVFTFHGVAGAIAGLFGRAKIRDAHRRHIESFKRFAEERRRRGATDR